MKKQLLSLVLIFLSITLFAQTTRTVSVPVSRQIVKTDKVLNSTLNGAFGGDSKSVVAVNLPANTVEWYYSFSTRNNGAFKNNLDLAIQITSLLASVSSGGTSGAVFTGLSKAAVNSIFSPSGPVPVSVYVMSRYEESNFLYGTNFNHYPAVSSTNATHSVVQVSSPNLQSGLLYLGFQNLSNLKGVFIDVEVVAIVLEKRQEIIYETSNSDNKETHTTGSYSREHFIGSWRDENSSFTLTPWGDIYIKWDSGQTGQGKWQFSNGQLNFDFSGIQNNRYKGNDFYTIVSLTGGVLKYKSVGTQQTFNATKVQN